MTRSSIPRALAWAILVSCVCGTTSPARAASLAFDQLSWLDNSGFTYEAQNSNWGLVNLALTSSDTSSLSPDGRGGLYGFVNLATSTPSSGGATTNWAVQNLLVDFSSPSAVGNFTDGLTFNLGNSPGSAVSSLNFLLNISPTALSSINTSGTAGAAGVLNINYLIGGTSDFGGGSGQTAPVSASNFVGAAPASTPGPTGSIAGKESDIPFVNEEINGCAPGAAARSIKYLQAQFGLNVPGSAQDVYNTLKDGNHMKSSVGANSTGTAMRNPDNYTAGKNQFDTENRLPISTKTITSFASAIQALKDKCDVELFVFFGTNPTTGKSMGGHLAFVTQIKAVTNAAGVVTGYTVTTLNTVPQGDAATANTVIDYQFDAAGNLQGYGTGGALVDFRVESVPEPSGLVMALTAAATGLLLVRRRRVGPGRAAA